MKCPRCHSENPDASRFCNACAALLRQEPEGYTSAATTVVASTKTLEPGRLFANKFRIIGEIGRGGMGVVFKAEDTRLKRLVALKLLPFEFRQSAEVKERFVREAQAAAGLDHPNICTVYEVEERDGQACIAMAYIEGSSLKERIAEGPLKLEEAVGLATQIAAGLEEAHRKGVVHRDIKPANIMVTPKGQAKIMDFGLAQLESSGDLTRTGTVMGTLAYMSPEQAHGHQVDARTDLWSLGCVLYEMLAGRRPFTGATEPAILDAILHLNPDPITAMRPDLPAVLDRILTRCLQKNPRDRYPDAGTLTRAFESVDLRDGGFTQRTREHAASIAVLPFVDMSPGRDQDYFGEGIAEELIHALACIRGLRVVARTSAFAFKGMNRDVREIGAALNVKVVLEGSIRKAGNRLRVTAQLINVADGFHLWSERYDREMDDLFGIQDEISGAIVDHLKLSLLAREKTALQKRSTDDPEAYRIYLEGLYHVARPDAGSIGKALDCFRAALDRDPSFALAYAGMARAYANLGTMNLRPPGEVWPKAKAATQKALSLDEDLAEGHAVMASLAFWYEWDWEAAERSFRRVMVLKPGDAFSHGAFGWFLLTRRQFDAALREIKQALELDPLMPLLYAWSVGLHAAAGRHDEALQEFAKAIEIDPKLGLAYFHAGLAYVRKSRLDLATEAFEKCRELGVNPQWAEMNIGFVRLRQGDRAAASRIYRQMLEETNPTKISPAGLALQAASLGQLDRAFEFFDQAYEQRDLLLTVIHVYADLFVPELRSDPRFRGLLARMKLPG